MVSLLNGPALQLSVEVMQVYCEDEGVMMGGCGVLDTLSDAGELPETLANWQHFTRKTLQLSSTPRPSSRLEWNRTRSLSYW